MFFFVFWPQFRPPRHFLMHFFGGGEWKTGGWGKTEFIAATYTSLYVEVAPCNGIEDNLGFRIPCCGFRIPGTDRYWILVFVNRTWILNSNSRLVGFRIPKPGIPHFSSKIVPDFGLHKQNFPDSGIRLPFSLGDRGMSKQSHVVELINYFEQLSLCRLQPKSTPEVFSSSKRQLSSRARLL